MRWLRRYPKAAVAVGVVLAVGVGAVVGDARTDDAEVRAPAAGPAVAAAAPAGALVDADEGGRDANGAAAASSSVAVVGEPAGPDAVLARVFDPETGVGTDAPGPIVEPAGAPLPGPDGEGEDGGAATDDADGTSDGDPEDGADGAADGGGLSGFLGLDGLTTWFVRFVDLCAEDPDAEGCPEGIGGSILLPISGDVRELPPIDVRRYTYAHLDPETARCPQGLRPDGTVDVFLSTNVPARSLRIEQVAGGRTLQRWDLATSGDERRRFDELWLGGGVPTTLTVRHCFTVDDWDRSDSHLRVRAEDDAGNVVEAAVTLQILNVTPTTSTERTGRPHLTVVGEGERLVVDVPIDGDTEQTWLVALHRVGPRATDATCQSIEGDVLDRRHRGGPEVIVGPLEPLPPGDHDARYDQRQRWFVYPGEGALLDLCVWVTRPGTRSYDRPVAVLRETRRVQAPRHYRSALQVSELRLDEGVDAGSIRIDVLDWVGSPSMTVPARALGAGHHVVGDDGPVVESGAAPHPDTTFLRITGPSGTVAMRSVPTPLACDPSCEGTKRYELPIPGRSYVDEICGGLACGDRPADFTDGVLTLSVATTAGPSGPPLGREPSSWILGPPEGFAAGAPADPGPIPRLDWNTAKGQVATVDGELAVELLLPFDREVVLADVMADAPPGSGPCVPAPVRSTAPKRTHLVLVRGVCAGHWYTFGFLATAADGGALDLRPWVDGRPTGRSGLLPVRIEPELVREVAYEVLVEPDGELIVDSATLVVAGRTIPLVARSHDGDFACFGSSALPVRRADRLTSTRPVWPLADPAGVELRVRAHRCEGERLTLDLVATPRLADVLAGPVTLRGESALGAAEVTLTVTP